MVGLAQEFRRRAEDLRLYNVPANIPWEQAAAIIEEFVAGFAEPVDLASASAEGGYTIGHLRRLLGLERGHPQVIPNAGTCENPMIARSHIPRKPGYGITEMDREPATATPLSSLATSGGDAEGPPCGEDGEDRNEGPDGLVAPPRHSAPSSRTQVARAVAAGV